MQETFLLPAKKRDSDVSCPARFQEADKMSTITSMGAPAPACPQPASLPVQTCPSRAALPSCRPSRNNAWRHATGRAAKNCSAGATGASAAAGCSSSCAGRTTAQTPTPPRSWWRALHTRWCLTCWTPPPWHQRSGWMQASAVTGGIPCACCYWASRWCAPKSAGGCRCTRRCAMPHHCNRPLMVSLAVSLRTVAMGNVLSA